MKFAAAPRFNFFTRAPVNDPDSGQPFRFEGVVIVAATSGRGLLTFGSEDGAIFQFDRQMQAVRNFQAYTDRLLACHQVRQQDVLVTVGHEEQEERVKVWSLGKTNQDGVPFCSGIFSVNPPILQPRSTAAAFLIGMASFASAVPFTGTRSTAAAAPAEQEPAPSLEPPTSTYACVDVHEGLSHMVIGTEGGLVQLFRGDVTRERHKRQLLHQCPRAVTCVSLRLLDAGGGREGRRGQRVLVFVATEGNVMSILAEPGRLGDKHEPRKTILLQVGAPLGCSAPVETLGSVGERDALFAVAGDDAIRVFDATGESRCYGFEGSKVVVRFFKHYLLFVTREARPGKRRGEQGSEVHLLTLYDLAQCIIAYSAPLSSEVRQVVTSGWGGVFVVCADRSVHCLTEADVQSKLHMLFTKKNYDLAVRIAKAHNFDAEGLADIFRRHGDYLYKKGDMDGAMKEYIKTIGNLEASYVIRRYLDASRIHNLTAYLRELHARHLETEDHTTLLLNCYTKLHDEDSLNLFITSDDTRVAMNAEAAIRVLCQAGYYALALVLAKKFSVHSWFLRIQVEHMGQFEEALRYIAALDTSLALRYAEEYGKLLMSKLPVKTTDLLLQLCSREAKANGCLDAERLEDYRAVFVNNRAGWLTFLEGFARLDPSDGAAVRRQLLELYLEEFEAGRGSREELEKKILELLEEASPYDQQALVQCHLHGFEAGYLKLCLRLGHLDQLMQHHVTADEPQEVLALCEQHGASNPDLWVHAVEYFAARERQNGGGAEIQRVLDRLRERNIMSPLMVVRLLATSSASCSLSAVKAYVLDQLEKEDRKIEADEDLIRRYKREIESAKQEIGQLEQSVKIFQNQKCSLCRTDLDLPAVFFFCDHSFHQECYLRYAAEGEEESDCPRCAEANSEKRDRLDVWNQTAEERASSFFAPGGGATAAEEALDFEALSRSVAQSDFGSLPKTSASPRPSASPKLPRSAAPPESPPRPAPKMAQPSPPRPAPKMAQPSPPRPTRPAAPKTAPLSVQPSGPASAPAAAAPNPRRSAAMAAMTAAGPADQQRTAAARQARNIFGDGRRPAPTAHLSTAGPPLGPNNPFAEKEEAPAGLNPFGEPEEEAKKEEEEEYPDELNPFA